MTDRVLFVGGDEAYLLSLAHYVNWCDGIDAEVLSSGSKAIASVRLSHFSSVVIDEAPPDMAVPDLCQSLRQLGLASPIFCSSLRDAESEIILALEAGATAILAKPIRARELLARLRYRSRSLEHRPRVPIVLGEATFDSQRRLLLLKERPVSLTDIETRILACLGQAENHAMTRDEITRTIWGAATRETAGRLKSHVCRLRRKIGTSVRILTTSQGYRIDV